MEIDRYIHAAEKGDIESIKRVLMILSEYIPNGIDNMVFLYKDDTKSLYLSSEGVKAVMIARGEFLPFIESHVANVSYERLKEDELKAVGSRLKELFGEVYNTLMKWLDYGLEDDPLYPKAVEYVNWYRERYLDSPPPVERPG